MFFLGLLLGSMAMLFVLALLQSGSRADEIERELWEKRNRTEDHRKPNGQSQSSEE